MPKQRNERQPDEFLLSGADVPAPKKGVVHKSSVTLDRFSRRFPDIQTGAAFAEALLLASDREKHFSILLLQADTFRCKGRISRSYGEKLLLDVAWALELSRSRGIGLWGLLDRKRFACLLPKMTPKGALAAARSIRKALARVREETLTIGIASYPFAQYPRSRILRNGRKALEHAMILGESSTVLFDGKSLNISGDLFYSKGDLQAAVRAYAEAILLDPKDFNAHNSLGVCCGLMGRTEDALRVFKAAAVIDPDAAMPLYNMGLIDLMEGERERALRHFLKAKAADENLFEAAYQIGKIQMEANLPEKAWKYLKDGVRLRPESAPAQRLYGECCLQLEKFEDALRAFKAVLKVRPNDGAAFSGIGCIFDRIDENPDIAILLCRHSVDIQPDNGLFRYRLGRLYLKQNGMDAAVEELERALRLGYPCDHLLERLRPRPRQKRARAS